MLSSRPRAGKRTYGTSIAWTSLGFKGGFVSELSSEVWPGYEAMSSRSS